VSFVARVAECAANHTLHSHLRDEDAQKFITRWKFGTIYIYSAPSIPTTETTHGLYEEEFSEEIEEPTQEIAPQGCEEAGEEACEEAPRQKTR
jgi:hypothetical protein